MRLRLQAKATLFFGLLMTVGFGAAMVFGYHTHRKSLLEMASQRYLTIAEDLAKEISLSCEITDVGGLQSVLDQVSRPASGVISIAVIDTNGETVAATPRRLMNRELPHPQIRRAIVQKESCTTTDLNASAWTLRSIVPIAAQAGDAPVRGALCMSGSLQDVRDDLGGLIRRQVTVFLILIGAGLLGTTLYLRRNIVRPIRELSKATRRVVAGDLRESGITKTRDEIGDLATSFDQMTFAMRKSERFLKDYNLILMQMVASELDRDRLDQVISSIAYALIEIDIQGNICRWNKAASDIFALQAEDVLGHPLRDSGISWDWPHVAALLDESSDDNQSWHRDGVPYTRPDRTLGYLTLTLSRVDSAGAGPEETRSAYVILAADVTERKRAADEIERTLSLLRATIESTADGILVVDQNGKIVISNKRFAEMWRIPEAVLASGDDEQALRFVHSQLRRPDEFLAKVRELYSQPDAESWDVLEFKDGRAFERYSRPQVINAMSVGRVWSFRDVSEVEFRSVFESSRDALMLLDREGFFDCNSATLELFGCSSKEQFTSKHPSELSPPLQSDGTDSLAAAQARIEAAFREGTQFFEWTHTRLDGSLFPAEVLLSRFEFHGRTVLQAVVRDITERKRAEERLQSFQKAVDDASDAIGMSTPEGRHYYQNRAFTRLFGLSTEDVEGKAGPASTVYADEETGREVFAALMRGDSWIGEVAMLDKDRNHLDILLRAYSIRDEQGNVLGLVGVHTDITERKKAELARAETLERQKRMNQLQQALLAPGELTQKAKMITDAVVEIFGADFCRIWVTSPGDLCELGCMHAEQTEGPHVCRHRDRCLHLRASSGRYTHTDGTVHRRVPFGCYKIGRVASGEEHRFLTNDAAHDPRVHDHNWVKELGLVSFAGYQLRPPDGESLGVMALFSARPITPEEDAQLDSLSTAAAQVVNAARTGETLRERERNHGMLFESSRDATQESVLQRQLHQAQKV